MEPEKPAPGVCWECHGSGACSNCGGEGQVSRVVARLPAGQLTVPDKQARDMPCRPCSGSGVCPRCKGKGMAMEAPVRAGRLTRWRRALAALLGHQ